MPSVLVVDDSSVERRLIGGLLQKDEELDVRFAENGIAALQEMARAEPDLVISDLQMPAMNGLELVREIKVHHSHVPVVLMTAHGSESIAIEALKEGASSYVPKDNLAESLSSCVSQILSIAAADRTSEELMNCLDECEFSFELDNDPGLIDPFNHL